MYSLQCEGHRNGRDHVDRLSVQQRWFVAPLLHRSAGISFIAALRRGMNTGLDTMAEVNVP